MYPIVPFTHSKSYLLLACLPITENELVRRIFFSQCILLAYSEYIFTYIGIYRSIKWYLENLAKFARFRSYSRS